MTVANDHIAHHKHVQALYEELLADVPGITVHSQPVSSFKIQDSGFRFQDTRFKIDSLLLINIHRCSQPAAQVSRYKIDEQTREV